MCSDQNSSELSLVIRVQLVGLVMNVCNQAPGIATWKMVIGVGPMLDSGQHILQVSIRESSD